MGGRPIHLVFIDSCAVNKMALSNLDPNRELDGSRFRVAYTTGLAAEYEQALAHPLVEPYIKLLLKSLLRHGIPYRTAGKSTDDDLVDLARRHFVITLDRKPPWDRAERHVGLIIWSTLESALRSGDPLVSVLRLRAPYLDTMTF